MCYPKDAYKKETVIKFYEEPTKEGREPEVVATIELTEEQIQHIYYFTDEYNLVYYDHWFAEIHNEDMEYIMEYKEKQ